MSTARIVAIIGLVLMSMTCSADSEIVAPQEAPTQGKVLFSDEFDSLNLQKYQTRFHWGQRWIADEQQVYVEPTCPKSSMLGISPFSVSNGNLHIQADVASPTVQPFLHGQKYTSGLLTTYQSFRHLYGYFEINAKMPNGKGFWPAFWLLPDTMMENPPEIDIFEVLGDRPNRLYQTVHWNDDTHHRSKQFVTKGPDLSADFHRYGVLWNEAVIAYYFDGQKTATMPTPNDMHKPMYLLVNLAVGGNWPGSPDSSTVFPGVLIVDYIRVYDFNSQGASSHD
jgi:beta-glucanase (GH16 family)